MATANYDVVSSRGAGTWAGGVWDKLAIDQMNPQYFKEYTDRVQQNLDRTGVLNQKLGISGNSGQSGGSAANSSSTSSLFGDLSGYTNQAKDLATFNLGLNKDQETFDSGLRETEAQSNFGRTTQLADQQIGGQYKLGEQQITGQKDITNLQQNATTDRLQRQLESQQGMQKSGFDQQNLYRAQSAALALRGLR